MVVSRPRRQPSSKRRGSSSSSSPRATLQQRSSATGSRRTTCTCSEISWVLQSLRTKTAACVLLREACANYLFSLSSIKRSRITKSRSFRYCPFTHEWISTKQIHKSTEIHVIRLTCHWHAELCTEILCFLQTSPWKSSCGACRKSAPARCAWTKKSTLCSSPVDTWWCARNVHRPWESAPSAEAWSKAQCEPSSPEGNQWHVWSQWALKQYNITIHWRVTGFFPLLSINVI